MNGYFYVKGSSFGFLTMDHIWGIFRLSKLQHKKLYKRLGIVSFNRVLHT